jgi:histidine triad (HIT) family protein
MASEGDEVAKAKAAAADPSDGGAPTVFDKLLSGEWSSDKVHEDDKCLAFRDINPQGPVHIVVIPKNRDGLTQLSKAREDQKDILGHLLYVAQDVGKKECPSGFRLVINDGEHGAQSVYHLHIHVIGKKFLFCIESFLNDQCLLFTARNSCLVMPYCFLLNSQEAVKWDGRLARYQTRACVRKREASLHLGTKGDSGRRWEYRCASCFIQLTTMPLLQHVMFFVCCLDVVWSKNAWACIVDRSVAYPRAIIIVHHPI